MEHHFTIPGRYDRVSDACEFIAAGAEEAGFNEDDIFRIQLACDEACTNIIEHAYGAEDRGEIRVSWEKTGLVFTINIHDNGRPFDPNVIPDPPISPDPENTEQLKIGGLGIHFMRTLMDDVFFSFDDSSGNKLTMIKRVPAKAAE